MLTCQNVIILFVEVVYLKPMNPEIENVQNVESHLLKMKLIQFTGIK